MQIFINFLSLSRIISGVLIFFILSQHEVANYIAFLLFIFAGLTDYYDGFLARKYNLVSNFGEILDPVSDKILVIFVLFSLSTYLGNFLVAFCSGIIISREVFISALRDYSSRNGISSATKVIYISKVKTAIQFFTIAMYLILVSFDLNRIFFVISDMLLILTVIITIYTCIIYTLNVINHNHKQ